MAKPMERMSGLMLFGKIVECGSLSGAAQQLGISRSSVSKQLAAFEQEIGARLLQRTTRKIALTELGEQIMQEALQVQEALAKVEAISNDFRQEVRGRLKVSCSSSFGRVHLVPLMREFTERYPEVDVCLQLEDRFVDLVAEQVDIAIRIGYLSDSSLIARRLGELTWQLCASPDYLARKGLPQTPSDLLAHDCLYYRNSKTTHNIWHFQSSPIDSLAKNHSPKNSEKGTKNEEHISVQGPLCINDACALVSAAIDGLGVLLIDSSIVQEALAAGQLVPLLADYPPAPGLPVYAVYPVRNFLPTKTHAFIDFLVDRLSPRIN